jgi:predicted alpha/beta superfamily hydrolase
MSIQVKKWVLLSWLLTIATTAVVAWFAGLYVAERPHLGERVQQRSLRSAALDESREYLVHLPESYDRRPARRYPVIYVLDGSSQDLHTAASAVLMARIGVIDEAIVVGIPNTSGPERQRDYTPPGMRQDTDEAMGATGRGDRFLLFLESELIPAVERDFRASSVRTLAGNSRGGLFVVYAMTEKTGLFDTYVANSPALWRDDAAMVSRLERFLRSHGELRSNFFMSLGSEENEKMKRAFSKAADVLNDRAPEGLRWRTFVSAEGRHANNAEMSTPVALQWAQQMRGSASGASARCVPLATNADP